MSLKDLHSEGIISRPPPIWDLVNHPYNFCSGDISPQSILWELQFKLQFKSYTPYVQGKWKISLFFIFHFGYFSVFSVTSFTPVGVLYSIPQKIPLQWCIIQSWFSGSWSGGEAWWSNSYHHKCSETWKEREMKETSTVHHQRAVICRWHHLGLTLSLLFYYT